MLEPDLEQSQSSLESLCLRSSRDLRTEEELLNKSRHSADNMRDIFLCKLLLHSVLDSKLISVLKQLGQCVVAELSMEQKLLTQLVCGLTWLGNQPLLLHVLLGKLFGVVYTCFVVSR